jgi:hypothetical protein
VKGPAQIALKKKKMKYSISQNTTNACMSQTEVKEHKEQNTENHRT